MKTCAAKAAHPAIPFASALATAIKTRRIGRTTTSLVLASMLSALLAERGIRSLRTTSRRTTGWVEARMVPRRRD